MDISEWHCTSQEIGAIVGHRAMIRGTVRDALTGRGEHCAGGPDQVDQEVGVAARLLGYQTGTLDHPHTFAIATLFNPARSMSYSGMKSSNASSAMRLSIRANAAPRQL